METKEYLHKIENGYPKFLSNRLLDKKITSNYLLLTMLWIT